MAYGPNGEILQPDPVITGIMVDRSNLGGWIGEKLCAVKPVPKDFVRWAKRNVKGLLSNMMETFRAPGARANLIDRPTLEWLTSIIQEDAVRAEFNEEDIRNSVLSIEPRVSAVTTVLNVLKFAFELRVGQLYDPTAWDAAQKLAASAPWNGAGSKILYDFRKAQEKFALNNGFEANFIRIPRGKLAGIYGSDEFQKTPNGTYVPMTQAYAADASGIPSNFFGLPLIVGTVRHDDTPTGPLTPALVWDKGALGSSAQLGYSPTLGGGTWDGVSPTFAACFENQINGSAFVGDEYLDPNFRENGVHIVHSNFRRSLPELINETAVIAITGI